MDANSLPDFKLLPYPSFEVGQSETLQLPSEPDTNNPITLNASSSWTYCGPLLTLDEDSLPSSFHTWAQATVNGSVLTPLFSFLAYVHEFLTTNNLAHYWLTVRATKGTTEFDIPRWHTDDLFFSPLSVTKPNPKPLSHRRSLQSHFSSKVRYSKWSHYSPRQQKQKEEPQKQQPQQDINYDTLSNTLPDNIDTLTTTPPQTNAQISTSNPNPPDWKLSTTLLGPGTLFIDEKSGSIARTIQRTTKTAVRNENPGHVCLSIRCVGCASAAETVRARLATDLKPHRIVQAQKGECVFFRIGEDEGAVHSEPRSHGDRIFVNVVPGDEMDLRCLMAKWGMEFPRAWCVGLPLQIEDEMICRNVGDV